LKRPDPWTNWRKWKHFSHGNRRSSGIAGPASF